MTKPNSKIEVRYVPEDTFRALKNISENSGQRLSTLLRLKLGPIIAAYSEDMKVDKSPVDKKRTITIKSVPEHLENDIKVIAENLGVTTSAFLKPHLKNIADQYPDHMKQDFTL